jgi:hypothetical protein
MARMPNRRKRLCGQCLVRTLAGVAWPLWASRPDGWPQPARCVHR